MLPPPYQDIEQKGQKTSMAEQESTRVEQTGQKTSTAEQTEQEPTSAEKTGQETSMTEQTGQEPTSVERTEQAPSRAEQRPMAETGTYGKLRHKRQREHIWPPWPVQSKEEIHKRASPLWEVLQHAPPPLEKQQRAPSLQGMQQLASPPPNRSTDLESLDVTNRTSQDSG